MATPIQLSDVTASKLVGQIALSDIGIVQVAADLNRTPVAGEVLSYEERPIEVTWTRRDGAVVAIFPCEIAALAGKKDGPGVQFARFRVVLRVRYHLLESDKQIEEESLLHYVGVVGFIHVWPYLRAEVQSLSSKLGLPALTLPIKVSGHAQALVRISASTTTSALPEELGPSQARRRKKIAKPASTST